MFLTADALHYLTEAGDVSLPMTGDGFTWLTPDRGLVLSSDGQIQAVAVDGLGITALGKAQVKEGLGLLLEDMTRLAFDMGTGRLLLPAGQRVYLFVLDEQGNLSAQGSPMSFSDHKEEEQRELRCLLQEDRALIFYKAGVVVYNLNLERLYIGILSRIPKDQIEEYRRLHPDCDVNDTLADASQGTWRYTDDTGTEYAPRYALLREQFGYGTMDYSVYWLDPNY